MKHSLPLFALLFLLVFPASAIAGTVKIVFVELTQEEDEIWTARVTLEHADSGWEHYADRFRLRGPDGTALGTRVLRHPHEDEQPFTRTLENIAIPYSMTTVLVDARDSQHGWCKPLSFDLRGGKQTKGKVIRKFPYYDESKASDFNEFQLEAPDTSNSESAPQPVAPIEPIPPITPSPSLDR